MRSSKSRSRKSGRNNAPNRSVGNIINRVFDSSGPEGKVRGTPQQIIDKYNQLARDAQLSNDRVAMENFQQHAEHYLRLLAEAQREMDQRREQQERENRDRQSERDLGQRDQNRDQGRDVQRDQTREGDGRETSQRENGQRENGYRDGGQRESGQRESGQRESGQRDGSHRDQGRDQSRQQNRERPSRQDHDTTERVADPRRDHASRQDVLDLGGDSGLVETPESRSDAAVAAPAVAPAPRGRAEPRSKPAAKPKADPATAATPRDGEIAPDQPKPKPRSRAPRKPREPSANSGDNTGTPEAAE